MVKNRMSLHKILEEIPGVAKVYFSPPPNKDMVYPCIVYSLDRIPTRYADNKPYFQSKTYSLMLIDYDPDSEIVEKILELPMCRFDRSFVSDGLNHFAFTITH